VEQTKADHAQAKKQQICPEATLIPLLSANNFKYSRGELVLSLEFSIRFEEILPRIGLRLTLRHVGGSPLLFELHCIFTITVASTQPGGCMLLRGNLDKATFDRRSLSHIERRDPHEARVFYSTWVSTFACGKSNAGWVHAAPCFGRHAGTLLDNPVMTNY
jgi:hypothetical protein